MNRITEVLAATASTPTARILVLAGVAALIFGALIIKIAGRAPRRTPHQHL